MVDIRTIQTIQEITARCIEREIFSTLFNKDDMSRDEIFDLFVTWANDFHYDEEPYAPSFYDQIDMFIDEKWKDYKKSQDPETYDDDMFDKFNDILDVHYGDDGNPGREFYEEKCEDKAWLKTVQDRIKEYRLITQ